MSTSIATCSTEHHSSDHYCHDQCQLRCSRGGCVKNKERGERRDPFEPSSPDHERTDRRKAGQSSEIVLVAEWPSKNLAEGSTLECGACTPRGRRQEREHARPPEGGADGRGDALPRKETGADQNSEGHPGSDGRSAQQGLRQRGPWRGQGVDDEEPYGHRERPNRGRPDAHGLDQGPVRRHGKNRTSENEGGRYFRQPLAGAHRVGLA